jgi:hypothetical protein
MTLTTSMHRNVRPIRNETPAHLFAVGQAVRLRDIHGKFPSNAEIYRITGTLPAKEKSPQYRIRNDDERYERVTTQDNLEPIPASPAEKGTTLIQRTFSHGQGTKAQQPRDSKAETGKAGAED